MGAKDLHRVTAAVARLNHRLEAWLWPILLVTTAVGLFVKGHARPLEPLLPYLLTYNILVTSLNCSLAQFAAIGRRLWLLAAPLAVLFLLLPALGFAMSRTVLAGYEGLGAGLILVTMIPSGVTGSVWTSLSGGNVSLSIAIVSVSNVLSVGLIPALFGWLGGRQVAVDAGQLLDNLLRTVLAPAVVGTFVNTRWRGQVDRVRPWLSLGVKGVIVLFTLITAARLRISGAGPAEVALATGCVALLVAAGYVTGYLMTVFGPAAAREDRISVMYACGTRNHFVGLSVATLFLPPAAVVAVLISNLFNHPAASVVHRLLHKGWVLRPEAPAARQLSGAT